MPESEVGATIGRRVLATGTPRPDAVTVLTVYIVLLYAVPSYEGIPALGSAGSPAGIFGLGAGLWWCWHQLRRPRPQHVTKPALVRQAMVLFLAACIASYVAEGSRPLPLEEMSPSDSGLLRVLSWLGVLLLACEGIPSRERFGTLVRRLVAMGAIFAALGLAQFATGQSIIGNLSIPGLSAGPFDSGIQDRGGFTRSAATATHPLEYAMVLCMILPLALNWAMHGSTAKPVLRWLPAATITLAAALSASRSALIGLLAALIVLVSTWPKAARRYAYAIALLLVAAIWVLVPGFVGTVRALFTGASEDSGVQSRTGSYDLAGQVFSTSPLFGRGFGTFLPQYRILDNQYLSMVIEVGSVGTVAFAGVVGAGVLTAILGRRASRSTADRDLGQAFVASIVAGATLFAFFDALAFPKAGGTLFLVIGLAGAYGELVPGSTFGIPLRLRAEPGALAGSVMASSSIERRPGQLSTKPYGRHARQDSEANQVGRGTTRVGYSTGLAEGPRDRVVPQDPPVRPRNR